MSSWKLSKSYDYDGWEVRYGQLGEGLPMVLVHGTPWSSFNLRHLIRKLLMRLHASDQFKHNLILA